MNGSARSSSSCLWKIDDGKMCVYPHPGQAQALTSEKRFVFVIAGTQGGKTSLGPFWLLKQIRHFGEGDYIAVTSTFPLLTRKMLPEFLAVARHTLPGAWRGSEKVYEFASKKGRVMFGSATNPESLEAATAKAAWLDECGQDDFRLESWEAVQRRLSLFQGPVLGTTTVYNQGWLYQQIYLPWKNGEDPEIEVVQFESIQNPAFPRAEFERMQRKLPAWKFAMFYRGLFEKPASLIYADFKNEYDKGHLMKPFPISNEWPRYVGIDPGPDHTASVWLAKDPAKEIYFLYRETLEGEFTTREHVERAKERSARENVVTWTLGQPSEKQYRKDWQDYGIPVREPPIVDVEAGIDRVIELFKTMRLFIFDTCRGILDELGTYSRELDENAQPTTRIKNKEKFHRLDALRYCVAGLQASRVEAW